MNDRNVKVGDKVRSYDFPGIRENCYMEGVVQKIGETSMFPGCDRYTILVETITWQGDTKMAPSDFKAYPPVNGLPKVFGGVCDGVVVIQRGKGKNDEEHAA